MAKRLTGRKTLVEQRTDAPVAKAKATNTRAPRVAAPAAQTPRTPIDQRSRPKVEPLVIHDRVTNEKREMPLSAYQHIRHEKMPINGGRTQQRYVAVSGDPGPEPKND